MSIFCFGLSHRTAAMDVRERFAISQSALPTALAQLKTVPGVAEGVIVSTCNRTDWNRPLFMIDLAMPRDIDLAVQQLDGIYLYDLDSLQNITERTLAVRKQESETCDRLIERHVQEFQSWMERTPAHAACSIGPIKCCTEMASVLSR